MPRCKSFLAVLLICFVIPDLARGQTNNNGYLPAIPPIYTVGQVGASNQAMTNGNPTPGYLPGPNGNGINGPGNNAAIAAANGALPAGQPPYVGIGPRVANNRIGAYVGNGPRDFNVAQVVCPGTNMVIGNLALSYSAFTSPAGTAGGAMINGGFTANMMCGSVYRWIQYISITGGAAGQNRNEVDAPAGQAFYPNFFNQGVTATLFDTPGRGPIGPNAAFTNLNWLATSALVCFDPATPNTLNVIGMFNWGFNIRTTPAGNGQPAVTNIVAVPPNGTWTQTQAAFNAFRANVTNADTRNRIGNNLTLQQGCCCVPEFGMTIQFALVIIGLFLVMRRARRVPTSIAA